MNAKRFRIAFSFAGEKREYVSKVANTLAHRFGHERILYDKYHEAEFSQPKLGLDLPDLYRDQTDLIVVVVCRDYSQKKWCGLEWRAIHGMLVAGKTREIMLCRFQYAKLQGLYENAGFSELDQKTPDHTAALILERLALNEGKPRDFYSAIPTAPPFAPGKLRNEDNPFQTAGALRHDHPTYIRRAADNDLERTLKHQDRLISITGEFGIGKSSLMQQARCILPAHHFFGGGLADTNSHDEARFIRTFFGFFVRAFGFVEDWDELDEHTRQSPSVLFLDDLSEVRSAGLGALIPALVERLTRPEAALIVITTTPKHLKVLFAKRDLDDPEYSRPWRNIVVGPMEGSSATRLLEFLPSRARGLAETHFKQIERNSQLIPRAFQRLCHRLYDAECDGLTDAELVTLLKDPVSYE